MQSHTLAALRRGVEAAVLAGVPQVIVPKIQEKLIPGEWESADVGPHFIEALLYGRGPGHTVGERIAGWWRTATSS